MIRIEDVDRGVKRWFERVVDAHVQVAQGERRAVAFTFASGERWVAAADRKGIRDRDGRLILPIIQVRRTGLDPVTHRSAMGTDTARLQIARLVSEKTADLASLDLSRPISERRLRDAAIYDIYSIPFPRQNVLSYQVTVQAQYQTHINEIIEKIQSRLNFVSVPSFVISLSDEVRNNGIPTGDGSTELAHPEHAPFDLRPPLKGYYVVGYMEGELGDAGDLDEFTDQERILQFNFSFKVPASLVLDPEGTEPAVKVERTAFNLSLLDEEVHFVERPEDLDRIFGKK